MMGLYPSPISIWSFTNDPSVVAALTPNTLASMGVGR
jgi:hypothetical protein